MQATRVSFANSAGEQLAARLERPTGKAKAYALFAHCFTCSKDIAAASRISQSLAQQGFGVLRFDFTGLGNSEGDFANTNFSSNVADLLSAAHYLRTDHEAPSLLVGHSLGGAAVLAAAASIPEAKAVATIGAPAEPAHVSHLFENSREEIESSGAATVSLGGREFQIKRQFLDDIASISLSDRVARLRKALLVMHAPNDEIVSVDNASTIFLAARHPKSFVSLDTADHLLTRRADSRYVAATIAAWASRYLPATPTETSQQLADGEVLVMEDDLKFAQKISFAHHEIRADEPQSHGGADTGPSPYELLLSSLGSCTAMTMRMYANRNKMDLTQISVHLSHEKIHAQDCDHCETVDGRIDRIKRVISISGDMTEAERESLLAIADKCPVHRTLHGEIDVLTSST